MKMVVKGTVIHGSGDGAKLGFPTANLSLSKPLQLPFGVYACVATINGKEYNGVLHFGPRDTQPFVSTEALVIQIQKDCDQAKKLLLKS